MSVNLLLDDQQPTQQADAWKNIKVYNAVVSGNLSVDGNITVDGSIIQPNNPFIGISSDFYSSTQSLSSQYLPNSELAFSNYSCILPSGITYVGDNITVSKNGYYIVNIQLGLRIQTYTTDTLFNLVFKDYTSNLDIAVCELDVNNDSEFVLSVNRVAFLETGKNYRIELKQSTAQNLSLYGTNFRSYMNIVKLF